MATMKAVLVQNGKGEADDMYIGDAPKPVPGPDSLLVKVKAFALNRADTLQRRGGYPAPAGSSPIMGLELSGIVEAVGENATSFRVGDHVFGLVGGGAYAEYCLLHYRAAILVPPELSFVQAAAVPEAHFTAYKALHFVCEIQSGEDVLIHAGASGVGVAAIQLAKMAGANRIIITAGSEDKLEFCKSLGATHGINYKTENFKDKIAEITNGRGVDCIVDFVGASYWDSNVASMAIDGRMCMLAFLGGATKESVNLAPFLWKRLRIQGSALRSRSLAYQIRLRDQFVEEVMPGLLDGRMKLIIDSEFPWTRIAEAHKQVYGKQYEFWQNSHYNHRLKKV
ncbi:hypothetical protein SmJEL517_g00536 [Synchytrium microbalum]|uniref:Enoyl reductase (ER) domain-containing protein n=1 Tax=Synchytrium microbalum TaxID=1806994 RepID=A0A507CEU3_9FUNG|nr:uncharacterized protein SmJEL517_g00536 [Synchytrium microbalum]TPX37709.1 hypothetical protein SmJEL517_g00536 [Synchytrium microbalum]